LIRCPDIDLSDQANAWANTPETYRLHLEFLEELRKDGCISYEALKQIPDPWAVDKYKGKELPDNYKKLFINRCRMTFLRMSAELEEKYPDYSKMPLQEYDGCINRFPEESETLAEAAYFKEAANRIGILYRKSNFQIICTASIVSAKYIKTATHCLEPETLLGASANGSEPTSINSLAFRAYTRPEQELLLVRYLFPDPRPYIYWKDGPYEKEKDYVLIELETPIIGLTENVRLGGYSSTKGKIIIPGFDSALAYGDKFPLTTDALNSVLSNWTKYLRWDGSGGCLIDRRRGNTCLLHSCVTLFGYSGAPMFGISQTEDVLIDFGVHSGAASNLSCKDDSKLELPNDYRYVAPNVGTEIDVTWIQDVLGTARREP